MEPSGIEIKDLLRGSRRSPLELKAPQDLSKLNKTNVQASFPRKEVIQLAPSDMATEHDFTRSSIPP